MLCCKNYSNQNALICCGIWVMCYFAGFVAGKLFKSKREKKERWKIGEVWLSSTFKMASIAWVRCNKLRVVISISRTKTEHGNICSVLAPFPTKKKSEQQEEKLVFHIVIYLLSHYCQHCRHRHLHIIISHKSRANAHFFLPQSPFWPIWWLRFSFLNLYDCWNVEKVGTICSICLFANLCSTPTC